MCLLCMLPFLLIETPSYLIAAYRAWFEPLLARGWAIAHVHVRGGSECGLPWYNAARGAGKHLSFSDLDVCL